MKACFITGFVAGIALCVLTVAVAGCFQSESTRSGATTTRREFNEQGTQGGQPYAKTGSETITAESSEQSKTKSGLDEDAVRKVVSAAVSAGLGDVRASVATLAAQSTPLTGNGKLDQILTVLAAYLTAKGGLTLGGKMLKPKEA